jgi:membrane protein implicated in regulation of membrane protease activity
MNNRRLSVVMEYVWIAVAVFAVVAGVHKTTVGGFGISYPFFIIAAIAALMYSMRRFMRKAREKAMQNKEKK